MVAIVLKNYKGAIVRSNITIVTCMRPELEDAFHALHATYMYTHMSHMGLWQPHATRTPQSRVEHCQQLIDRVVIDETYEAPVIFTYSEAYVLRLAKAVDLGILKHNQVAVNILSKDNWILHNPFDIDGGFELPFPDGYYEWRANEVFY